MRDLLGVSAVLALVIGGAVFSQESPSILEQGGASAQQAVESAIGDAQSAVDDLSAVPAEEALPQQEKVETIEQVATPAPVVVDPAPVNARYIWGLTTSPAPPMVLAQINLPQGSALIVEQIKPGSPAEQAGIKRYDVIVSIDGVAIANVDGLSAEIQKAAGKPQKLVVLRGGQAIELTIAAVAEPVVAPFGTQPGTRMFIDPGQPDADLSLDPDQDDDCQPAFPGFQRFMERQRRQMEFMRQRMEAMENAMRQGMPGFVPFAPGVVPAPAPGVVPAPAPAPNGGMMLIDPQDNDPNVQTRVDSFSVQVQKNGDAPAMIKIKENGNEYQVDENSIDQLPENVRKRLNFNFQMNQP